MGRKVRQVVTGGLGAFCFLALSTWIIVLSGAIKSISVAMVLIPIVTGTLLWTAGKREYAIGVLVGSLLFCISLVTGIYLYW